MRKVVVSEYVTEDLCSPHRHLVPASLLLPGQALLDLLADEFPAPPSTP
jgi:hypothetical protein